MAEARRTYQLKVQLKDIRPPIWRRILVYDDTPLPKLHVILQATMGWHDCHLHSFEANGRSYGPTDADWEDQMVDENNVVLHDIANGVGSKFSYCYDFGDDWNHAISVEKIVETSPDVQIPSCLKGKRACPPEDVGGYGGYEDFLEAIRDPEHSEHDEMLDWVGGEFNSEEFNIQQVNQVLRRLR